MTFKERVLDAVEPELSYIREQFYPSDPGGPLKYFLRDNEDDDDDEDPDLEGVEDAEELRELLWDLFFDLLPDILRSKLVRRWMKQILSKPGLRKIFDPLKLPDSPATKPQKKPSAPEIPKRRPEEVPIDPDVAKPAIFYNTDGVISECCEEMGERLNAIGEELKSDIGTVNDNVLLIKADTDLIPDVLNKVDDLGRRWPPTWPDIPGDFDEVKDQIATVQDTVDHGMTVSQSGIDTIKSAVVSSLADFTAARGFS